MPNKEILLKKVIKANKSSNYITKHIISDNIIDLNDLSKSFLQFKQDIVLYNTKSRKINYNELYLNNKETLKLRFHQELITKKTLDLIEIEKPNESKSYFLLESLSKNFVRESNMSGFIFPSICDMSHIEKVEFSVGAKYLLNHSLRELFGGLAENKLRLIQMLKKYNSYRMALSGDLDRDYKKLLEISNIQHRTLGNYF